MYKGSLFLRISLAAVQVGNCPYTQGGRVRLKAWEMILQYLRASGAPLSVRSLPSDV